jgi:hypothetical protein
MLHWSAGLPTCGRRGATATLPPGRLGSCLQAEERAAALLFPPTSTPFHWPAQRQSLLFQNRIACMLPLSHWPCPEGKIQDGQRRKVVVPFRRPSSGRHHNLAALSKPCAIHVRATCNALDSEMQCSEWTLWVQGPLWQRWGPPTHGTFVPTTFRDAQ